jgi:hypothetical protein
MHGATPCAPSHFCAYEQKTNERAIAQNGGAIAFAAAQHDSELTPPVSAATVLHFLGGGESRLFWGQQGNFT